MFPNQEPLDLDSACDLLHEFAPDAPSVCCPGKPTKLKFTTFRHRQTVMNKYREGGTVKLEMWIFVYVEKIKVYM